MIRRSKRREREIEKIERALNIKPAPDALDARIGAGMALLVDALTIGEAEEFGALLELLPDVPPEHQARVEIFFDLLAHAVEEPALFKIAMEHRRGPVDINPDAPWPCSCPRAILSLEKIQRDYRSSVG